MLENDLAVAAYRDAVLWHGAVVRLTPTEAVAVCRHVLSRATDVATRRLISHGFFVISENKGALLAVPRIERCVTMVSGALRSAGLKAVANKITRAART